jgi:NCAIR mutase (PurE)-related protein
MQQRQRPKATLLARLTAGKIKKEDFLAQLKPQLAPFIKKDTDTEEEVKVQRTRIKKSGFESVFNQVGITDEDLRKVIEEIKSEKT